MAMWGSGELAAWNSMDLTSFTATVQLGVRGRWPTSRNVWNWRAQPWYGAPVPGRSDMLSCRRSVVALARLEKAHPRAESGPLCTDWCGEKGALAQALHPSPLRSISPRPRRSDTPGTQG